MGWRVGSCCAPCGNSRGLPSGKLGKPARETEKKPPFGDDLPEPFVGVIPFFARGSGDDFFAVDVAAAAARRRSNSSVGMVSMLIFSSRRYHWYSPLWPRNVFWKVAAADTCTRVCLLRVLGRSYQTPECSFVRR